MTPREQLIRDLFTESSRQPFEWGSLDCAHFASEAVKRLTGVDHAGGYQYSSEGEANAYVSAAGGLVALTAGHLGDPVESVLDLQDGDVAVVDLGQGVEALGVVVSNYVVLKSPRRLVRAPLRRALAGWRVG